jgi:hypothetical protein
MLEGGISPNLTYGLVVDGPCEAQAMDQAKMFLNRMIEDGLRYCYASLTAPHILVLCMDIALQGSAKRQLGSLKKWPEFFESDCYLYSLDYICTNDGCSEARKSFEKGQNQMLPPTTFCLHRYAIDESLLLICIISFI